jgi:hypothetical protein
MAIALGVLPLIAACRHGEVVMIPPPPATEAQVAREVKYIKEHFLARQCFADLEASRTPAQLPSGKKQPTYSVSLPSSELASDQFEYVVVVRRADRMGYLVRSGGFAGVYEQVGPVSLVPCLQEVFKPGIH